MVQHYYEQMLPIYMGGILPIQYISNIVVSTCRYIGQALSFTMNLVLCLFQIDKTNVDMFDIPDFLNICWRVTFDLWCYGLEENLILDPTYSPA